MTDGGWTRPEGGPVGDGVELPTVVPGPTGSPRRRTQVTVPWLTVFERPLTLADTLDGGFAIIKGRPRVVAVFALVFFLPVQLIVFAFDPRSFGGLVAILTDPEYFSTSTSQSGFDAAFPLLLLGTLPLSFVTAGVAKLVEGWLLGRDRDARTCLRAVGARAWLSLVVAWCAVHVVELVGVVVIVGPLVFMTFFLVTAPAVVLEGLGPFAAMKRSWTLVGQRRFWPTFGIALTSALISSVVATTLPVLPVAFAAQFGFGGDTAVVAAASMAANLLAQTFVAGVAVLTYFDLRVRTEGLDLQLAVPGLYYAGTGAP